LERRGGIHHDRFSELHARSNSWAHVDDWLHNTVVGYYADVDAGSDHDSTVIGALANGKGSNTTVLGSTYVTDTWLRGNKLHVGNEDATDKYFYFQRTSSGGQPGFKWNNATSKLQWSHDGTTYNDFTVGGGSFLTGYTNDSPSYNTALGIGAGTSVSSGTTNTFVGYNAGNLVTTGSGNLIAGSSAGAALTTQSYNIALGNGAMQTATGGSCTSVGYQAAYYGTGSSNVGVGYQAAKGNTTASGGSNVAVGASSLAVYTTGASNAMVGYQTGMALTTGSSNVAIGGIRQVHNHRWLQYLGWRRRWFNHNDRQQQYLVGVQLQRIRGRRHVQHRGW
jgi:hypothetical protein